MPRIYFTREYQRQREDLRKKAPLAFEKLREAERKAQDGSKLLLKLTKHGESRIPRVEKYNILKDYRLVVQRVKGFESDRIFVYAGREEETNRWLDRQREIEFKTVDCIDPIEIERLDSQKQLAEMKAIAASQLRENTVLRERICNAELESATLRERICDAESESATYQLAVEQRDAAIMELQDKIKETFTIQEKHNLEEEIKKHRAEKHEIQRKKDKSDEMARRMKEKNEQSHEMARQLKEKNEQTERQLRIVEEKLSRMVSQIQEETVPGQSGSLSPKFPVPKAPSVEEKAFPGDLGAFLAAILRKLGRWHADQKTDLVLKIAATLAILIVLAGIADWIVSPKTPVKPAGGDSVKNASSANGVGVTVVPTNNTDEINPETATKRIDKEVTVLMRVLDGRPVNNLILLNSKKSYTDPENLTIVLEPEALTGTLNGAKYGQFAHRWIRVKGTVTLYKKNNRPQIIVNNEKQIEFVD